MKILILNWRDPKHPFAGGAEKSVLEHAKYWMKKGADISWFAASFDNAKKEENIEGIKIIRAGNHYTVHLYFIFYIFLRRFNNFDFVLDCFHFVPFFTPIFMPKTKKIALIQETGGKLWFQNIALPFSLIGYLIEPAFFLFYRRSRFITASQSTKEDLAKFGISEDKVSIIAHGVDRMNSKSKKEKSPTVMYLGLLTKDKGFEDACNAVSLVKKRIPSLNFWIAGKEGKKGDYNWYGGKVKKFANYLGFVSDKEKFNRLGKAWVLVHPSEKEGWGLTVIEAASQATPTVGYNVGGLRDSVIDGKTGILTSKDTKSLAQALFDLLNNKKQLEDISLGAIHWSKNFDWQKAGAQSWKMINTSVRSK